VATAVLALDHVPPGTLLERVVVEPTQMVVEPVMGPGLGLTVTVVLVEHPVEIKV
jgi:hypothetical protein